MRTKAEMRQLIFAVAEKLGVVRAIAANGSRL